MRKEIILVLCEKNNFRIIIISINNYSMSFNVSHEFSLIFIFLIIDY